MLRPPRLVALLALLAASPLALAARGYRDEAFRVADFQAPPRWQPVPQLPYPGLLTAATDGKGTSIVLSAQRVVPGEDALTLAAAARAVLLRQGYTDAKLIELPSDRTPQTRVRLEAAYARGAKLLRQVYVVDDDVALVLTLTAPATAADAALSAFDAAVGSLEIDAK